jgi:hypothetical protein
VALQLLEHEWNGEKDPAVSGATVQLRCHQVVLASEGWTVQVRPCPVSEKESPGYTGAPLGDTVGIGQSEHEPGRWRFHPSGVGAERPAARPRVGAGTPKGVPIHLGMLEMAAQKVETPTQVGIDWGT